MLAILSLKSLDFGYEIARRLATRAQTPFPLNKANLQYYPQALYLLSAYITSLTVHASGV